MASSKQIKSINEGLKKMLDLTEKLQVSFEDTQKTIVEGTKAIDDQARKSIAVQNEKTGANKKHREEITKEQKQAQELLRAKEGLEMAYKNNAIEIIKVKKVRQDLVKQQKLELAQGKGAVKTYDQLSARYRLAANRAKDLAVRYGENNAKAKEAIKVAKQYNDQLKKVDKSLGNQQRNVGNYTEGLNKLKAGFFGITAAIAAASGVISALRAYISNIKEVNAQTTKTQRSFNLTREEAVGLTKDIRAVAAAYDQDFNNVLKSSNALSKEFGITGAKALSLIEKGFRKGADMNGEFLALLKEYPAQLKTVGLSANESIALITQTEQQGLFSDKGIDAIKEAGIRLRELTPATKAALEAIGLSGDEIQRQLETGEKTLFEVTQNVSEKMSELPPQSVEVGTAIADIFGGPGEDVGLRFLTTLGDIDLELNNIKSTLSPVEESSASLKKEWQGLKDEVTQGEGVASDLLAFAQKTIAAQFAIIKGTLGGVSAVTKAVEESVEDQQAALSDGAELDAVRLKKKQAEQAKADAKALKEREARNRALFIADLKLFKLEQELQFLKLKNSGAAEETLKFAKLSQKEAAFIEELRLTEKYAIKIGETEKDILLQKAEEARQESAKIKVPGGDAETDGILAGIDAELKAEEELLKSSLEKQEDLRLEAGKKEIADLKAKEEQKKEALKEAGGLLLDTITMFADQRIEQADRVVEEENAKTDSAERNLDRQIALATAGHASNVEDAQKALDLQKATQQKALAEKKRALEQKQKLETIEQGISIITSVANIIQGFSSIPIVGWALGIAAGVAMLGAFASQKRQAKAATQSFGEGGVVDLEGGSHASGNDIHFGNKDGKELRAEGGEKAAIFSRKATKKYGGIINSFVKDANRLNLEDRYSRAFDLGSMPVIVENNSNFDSSEIKETNALLRQLIANGSNTDSVLENKRVTRKGNVTYTTYDG